MTRYRWLKILEESQSLRRNITMMSDIGLRALEDLEETHRNLEKSVEMIEEKQRLLELVSELREGIHNADGQISRLAELVSSGLLLAQQRDEPGNGNH